MEKYTAEENSGSKSFLKIAYPMSENNIFSTIQENNRVYWN